MFFDTWRKYLRELSRSLFTGRRSRTVRHRTPYFKPTVSQLEDRLAPAAAFALSGLNLLSFDTNVPNSTTTTPIINVADGETLVGLDFRPQNGHLYSMGVSTAGAGTLYNISTRTGFATPIGAIGGVTPTAPMPDPTLVTSGFGFDFNPQVDRLRVVTSAGQSFVVDPNTGLVVANAPTLNGDTMTADGTAYTNNQPNTTVTTQYTIDSASDRLYLQNPASSSTTAVGAGLGVNFDRANGFDIPAGVNAASPSGTPVTSGSAFAILTVNGVTALYTIDLVDGDAAFVGNVGNGATPVQGFAVQSKLAGIPVFELGGNGTVFVRSNTAQANAGTQISITGVDPNDVLVGIDFRPATGQLFGLGVNHTPNTGTLYRIDPQTGVATSIGTVGSIAFQDGAGSPVDLPDPATTAYGFDFNPTVDLIRVVTSTGLNFRVNPTTGAAVDGNLGGGAGSVPNTNTDANINGSGSTGVSGAAYTNSFGQTLGVNGPTTQYTLDAAQNMLFIQFPPNSGTQTAGVTVAVNNVPLDFTNVKGFDIPGSVRVAASGGTAGGFGYAVLTVAGVDVFYRIDLTTGAATDLGPAATSLQGIALGDEPEIIDLRVTKTNNVTAVSPGGQVTYTITVSNVGTLAVIGANVLDSLTASLTNPTFTAVGTGGASGFTANGAGDILDLVNLPLFSSITYTVTGTVPTNVPGILTNTVTVNIAGGTDANPGDNSATDTDLAGNVAFAATTDNRLLRFFTNSPSNLLSNLAITGLNMGETIAGMDFRPLTNELFALTSANRVVTINVATAAATEVNAGIVYTPAFTAGSPAGFDFNPTVDRLRLVNAANDNARYNPNNNQPVDSDADPGNGITPDNDLAYIATDPNVGVDPNVVASAYDRNDLNANTQTTLFGIDSALNNLVRQGSVNGDMNDLAGGGTPNGGLLTTIGTLGIDVTDLVGFDISGAGAGNNGAAFAAIQLQGDAFSRFYSINLATGAASLIGAIGGSNVLVAALAVSPLAGVPFTDDFNRANAGNLGPNWTTQAGTASINGNTGAADPNAVTIATVNTATFSNVAVQADFANLNALGARAGLVARYTGTGEFNSNFYLAMVWRNSVTGIYEALLFLKQNNNPSYQQIGATVDLTGIFTGAGTLRFEVVGAQLKLFINGTLRAIGYDPTLTAAGQAGIRAQACNFDNFSAGSIDLLTATLPFTDPFASPNGSNLSRFWTEKAGMFQIQNGMANAGLGLATLNTAAVADTIVRAEIVVGANGYAGLVARQTGTTEATSSFYLGVVDNVGGVFTAYLFRKLAGAGFVQLASVNVTALFTSPGTKVLRFETLGNQLKLYVNDVFQLVAYDSMIAGPGQVGMRGDLATYDNFNALAAPPVNTSTPFTDNFNNPANEPDLARTWTERAGAFSTQNDNAAALPLPTVSLATLNTAALNNTIIEATVNLTTPGAYAGIVARYAGPGDDNYYLAVLFNNGGNYEAYLFRKQNGVFTQLSFQALAPAAFTGIGLLGFTLNGQSLELRVNGALRGAAMDNTFAAGHVGMRGSGSTFDDFTVQ